MGEVVISVLSLLVGCVLIFLRVPFARIVIEQQNKFWGFNFAEGALKTTQIVSLIVGVGFVIVGILPMLDIVISK